MALRARLNQRIRAAKNVGRAVLANPGLSPLHDEARDLLQRMSAAWQLCESLDGDRRALRARAEPVATKLAADAATLLTRAERLIDGAPKP